jgi:hypothetical protein
VVITLNGQPFSATVFTVAGGEIVEIAGIRDADRVRRRTAAVLADK